MTLSILTERQIAFLAKAGTSKFIAKKFYLTGGTALAAFYLKHRYSEDLDFFSETEFELLSLDVFFKHIKKDFGASQIDFQQSFNRNLFFLDFGDEVLKTEFTFFPFPRIEKGKREHNFEIDSLLDIAVNKLFTIYQRNQARDYIDLYCICGEKGWKISDLIKKAKTKFDWHIDPIQLGTQFVKVEEAKDYPKMIKHISPEDWRGFFLNEAKALESEILS